MRSADIRLRRADPRDRFAVRGWLGGPGGEIWTGTRAALEAAITMALAHPAALARIAERDGKAWGYVHALDLPAAGWARRHVPAGTVWLDVATAEPAVACGADAVAMLGSFAQEVFETTLAPALGAIVALRNETVMRCFERAGFTWRAISEEAGTGPVWLLLRQRP